MVKLQEFKDRLGMKEKKKKKEDEEAISLRVARPRNRVPNSGLASQAIRASGVNRVNSCSRWNHFQNETGTNDSIPQC